MQARKCQTKEKKVIKLGVQFDRETMTIEDYIVP